MMAGDRQAQKAGDHAQLVQAGTINIINGIDEKRAREIFAETYEIAKRNFTEEAYMRANERVQRLEAAIMARMEKVENALDAFSDPAFQILLASAQKTAAATEREVDYDMLSELLMCRIVKGKSRKTAAGISRAVEIIDEIDDDALCALTVAYAVEQYIPVSGECEKGLTVLNSLYEKLFYMELPNGTDWIEHLDLLDAVRISSFRTFKKAEEFFPQIFEGYSTAGIKTDSDAYKEALRLLVEADMNPSILLANECLPGYVRLPVSRKERIKKIVLIRPCLEDGASVNHRTSVTQQEQTALEAIWELYTKDRQANDAAKVAFMSCWDRFPALEKLHVWWDKLPTLFTITPVGTVLAYTNAKRCDSTLPEMSLET